MRLELPRLGVILVCALGLWRIAHLLSVEEGPFALSTRLRLMAGDGFLSQALDCFYCMSLWLAIPLAAFIGADWTARLLLWPALSGAACLLEQATRRSEPGLIYEAPKEPPHVL
jgi:hypothetical protein